MNGADGPVLAWVANQPVLVGALLFAVIALSRVVSVLFQKLQTATDEKLLLAREVMTVTAATTTALESNTEATRENVRAIERLAESQRNRTRG